MGYYLHHHFGCIKVITAASFIYLRAYPASRSFANQIRIILLDILFDILIV